MQARQLETATQLQQWTVPWGQDGKCMENSSEWLYVDSSKATQITGVNLYWEGAYAKAYQIQFSNDEENWETKYSTTTSNGEMKVLT